MKNKNKKIKETDPLGVLLELLENQQLEITDFSLAEIADEYLDYLNKFENQDKMIENISEFLWVASRLVLIKSKIILNKFGFQKNDLSTEEGESELKNRLIEYKRIKEISLELKRVLESKKELLSKKKSIHATEECLTNFNIKDLKNVFQKIIRDYELERKNIYQKKEVQDVIKIKDKIKEISEVLLKIKKIKFSQLVSIKNNKLELVVSFLSILELFKKGLIDIKQQTCFEELEVASIEE